ncbi:hypothetical protein RSM1_20515 [Methylobacterium radiotolerans]|nr:hypothetical protein RSM1_20515 [Methylobacterium radiotolerans]
MGVGAAVAEHHDIPGLRVLNFGGALEHEAEVALVVAVEVPILRVGARVESRHEAGIDEHAHEEHAAIDADAAQVGAGMVGGAKPASCLAHEDPAHSIFSEHSEPSTRCIPGHVIAR